MTMLPHFDTEHVTVWHGDCIDVMRQLPDASVDAVVTDPPYGLEFMGKDWDAPWENDPNVGKRWGSGMGEVNMADGGKRLPRPSFEKNSNVRCRTCTKWRVSSNPCKCEKPDFPNLKGENMRAFQAWCEQWAAEALRVLKPGGYLAAFGGTRTYHRLTCGIEDAGFEIRDSIAWLYGSGFAKSWNFGTQYPGPWCECRGESLPSSHAGNADLSRLREDVHTPAIARGEGEHPHLLTDLQRDPAGSGVGEARPQGASSLDSGERRSVHGTDAGQLEPVLAGRDLYRAGQGLPDGSDARPSAGTGERLRGGTPARHGGDHRAAGDATRGGASHQPRPGGQPAGEPASVRGSHGALDDGALRDGPICPRCGGLDQAYKGAGSALKPAFEPIVVARKPLAGTIAQNVARYGTGALNIDASRIAAPDPAAYAAKGASVVGLDSNRNGDAYGKWTGKRTDSTSQLGRWPSNVILDEFTAPLLDAQSGTRRSAGNYPSDATTTGLFGDRKQGQLYDDQGGASRFFYTAKASTDERPNVDGVAHPTVKPVDLMRWLVRLVTPKGGTVLEPFAGSGTTVEAAVLEGFRCIAIEREADYLPLIMQRVSKPHAVGLDFGDWEDAS